MSNNIIEEALFLNNAYEKAIKNKKGTKLIITKAEFIVSMESMLETAQISEPVFTDMVNKINNTEYKPIKTMPTYSSPSCGSSRSSTPSCGSSRYSSPSCGSSRSSRC